MSRCSFPQHTPSSSRSSSEEPSDLQGLLIGFDPGLGQIYLPELAGSLLTAKLLPQFLLLRERGSNRKSDQGIKGNTEVPFDGPARNAKDSSAEHGGLFLVKMPFKGNSKVLLGGSCWGERLQLRHSRKLKHLDNS